MSYEFKKLGAADTVEFVSDVATVLIEEDGVIKRAPKGKVGGVKVASTAKIGQTIVVKAIDEDGKPTEWECTNLIPEPDMVITVQSEPSGANWDNSKITAGSVENVMNAIKESRAPNVKVRYCRAYPNDSELSGYFLELDGCITWDSSIVINTFFPMSDGFVNSVFVCGENPPNFAFVNATTTKYNT